MKKKGLLLAACVALATLSAPVLSQELTAGEFNDGIFAAEAGDYDTAVAKWLPLANSDDADAQFNMALIYHKGLGVKRDEGKAVRWYHRAADNGNQQAQQYLSVAYGNGWFGLPQNLKLAQYWEERLAQK